MPPKKGLEFRDDDRDDERDTVVQVCPTCSGSGENARTRCACFHGELGEGFGWVPCPKNHREDPEKCQCKGSLQVVGPCPYCLGTPGWVVSFCFCSIGRHLYRMHEDLVQTRQSGRA